MRKLPEEILCPREQVVREYEQAPCPYLEYQHEPPHNYVSAVTGPKSYTYSSVIIETGGKQKRSKVPSDGGDVPPSADICKSSWNIVLKMLEWKPYEHSNDGKYHSRKSSRQPTYWLPKLWHRLSSRSHLERMVVNKETGNEVSDSITCYYFSIGLHRKASSGHGYSSKPIVLFNHSADIYAQLCQRVPHHSFEKLCFQCLPLTRPLIDSLSRLAKENGISVVRKLIIKECSLVAELGVRPALLRLLDGILCDVHDFDFLCNQGLSATDGGAEFLDAMLSTRALLSASYVYIEFDEIHSSAAQFSDDALIAFILGSGITSVEGHRRRCSLTVEWQQPGADFLEKLLKHFLQAPEGSLLPVESILIRLPGLFEEAFGKIPRYDIDSLSYIINGNNSGKGGDNIGSSTIFNSTFGVRELICIENNTSFFRKCPTNTERRPWFPKISACSSSCYECPLVPCTKTVYELRYYPPAHSWSGCGNRKLLSRIEVVTAHHEPSFAIQTYGLAHWEKHRFANELRITFEPQVLNSQ